MTAPDRVEPLADATVAPSATGARGAALWGIAAPDGGVSDKMLIQHLKELCADGLVERKDYQEIPPRVEYSMTRFGASLGRALAPLCQWGTRHEDEVGKLLRRRQRARGGRMLL